jgi:hypothetical protein
MTKHILLFAALGLALGAVGAQAQEIITKDADTTVYSTNAFQDKITTYTSYELSESEGRTRETAYIRVHTIYGMRRYNSSYQDITPADSTTSFTRDAGWKSPAVAPPQLNHDGRAYNSTTHANPVAALAQIPVTVIEGPLTPEQIRRLVNGE